MGSTASYNLTFVAYIYVHIKKVIFNEPATIVFWTDGTKTVVKTSPNETFDKEKGILWAYFIKTYGKSKTQCQKEIRKIVGKEE